MRKYDNSLLIKHGLDTVIENVAPFNKQLNFKYSQFLLHSEGGNVISLIWTF